MKNNLLLILAVFLFTFCNSEKERKTEAFNLNDTAYVSSQIEKANKLNEKKQQEFNDSIEQLSLRQEKELAEKFSGLRDSCYCMESYFSKEGKPFFENFVNDYHFIVCGFSGYEIFDTIIGGKKYSDGSIYFRGLEIFECNKIANSILSEGEYFIEKVEIVNDRIEISRCEYLPVGNDWKRELVPVFTIRVDVVDNEIKLDTSFVLNLSNISKKNISDFEKGLLKLESYDNKIGHELIIAIIKYPDYSDNFMSLGPFDGADAEDYYWAKEYYKIFEREMENKK